jgi:hypothetical protein
MMQIAGSMERFEHRFPNWGPDLLFELRNTGKLSWFDCIWFARLILEALAIMHTPKPLD